MLMHFVSPYPILLNRQLILLFQEKTCFSFDYMPQNKDTEYPDTDITYPNPTDSPQ